MDYSNELLKGVKWVFFYLDDTLWDFSANSDITLKDLYNNFSVLLECYPDYSEYDEQYRVLAIIAFIILLFDSCVLNAKSKFTKRINIFTD